MVNLLMLQGFNVIAGTQQVCLYVILMSLQKGTDIGKIGNIFIKYRSNIGHN
ncbi:hypothetical protein HanPI659440_Chr17g0676161 [Helianthus annuus]|nr:hypothetical protein HanPI659440_Chr17g0676161 [Helianthus annuus]